MFHTILNMYASSISDKASSICFLCLPACSRTDRQTLLWSKIHHIDDFDLHRRRHRHQCKLR